MWLGAPSIIAGRIVFLKALVYKRVMEQSDHPIPVEQFNPKDREIIALIDETLQAVGATAIQPVMETPKPTGRVRHINRNKWRL